MLPAMIKRIFVVVLLGLGFAKLPAAELKIWKLLDVWPGKVPGEKGDVPSETLTTHKYRGAPVAGCTTSGEPGPASCKGVGA